MSQSTLNSFIGTIPAGGAFTGKPEVINGSISINCFLKHSVDLILNIFQTPDGGITYVKTDSFNAFTPTFGQQSHIQFYIKGLKGYVQVENLGIVDATNTVLRTLYTPNNRDGTSLQPTYVIVAGMPTPPPITGTVAVSNFPAVQDISGSISVSNFPAVQDISGSISVSNFPAVQDISGSISVSNFPAVQDISGSISVSNFPAVQDISGSIAVSNFPAQQLVSGENSNFEFYPTPANNTSAIYADRTQGTNVSGGWKYTNAVTGKINWYCYASATPATDYKVSQLNSLYTVINQQSTLGLATAQNPFIIMYTRPTSTATTWYQNKFFWGSNALTDTTGVRLLYTGTDPVGVHPEIVAPNRIQLDFKPLLSTSTIALSQDESVWLGSLQTTNNTTPAGSFDFTMQEFGVDWVKTPAVLPIEFGKVQVEMGSSLNTATYNQVVSFGGSFQGTAYDMGDNSVVDVLLLATGIIATGVIRLDYSIDGTTWFPNNTTTYTISSTDPHLTIIGLRTGSRFIRVSSGLASLFTATNLQMTYSSKRG